MNLRFAGKNAATKILFTTELQFSGDTKIRARGWEDGKCDSEGRRMDGWVDRGADGWEKVIDVRRNQTLLVAHNLSELKR